jgi:hypothetical protein
MNYKAGGIHWILDSGCTQHMTGQVKMFTSLVDDVGDQEQVSFGDNSKGRISGLGEISLTDDLSLSNVLFVDSCSYNLLSIAQFCDLSHSCTFDDEGVTITNKKTNEVVFKGFRYGNLYLVDFASHEANLTSCLISKTSKGWLWHRRIAHIGMSQLKKAFKKGIVLGVKDATFEKDKLCSACQADKQVESHHPMKAYVSTTRSLELMHMDLFGPTTYKSLGGNLYCLAIVDGYSHYTRTFFLEDKGNTFDIFKKFSTRA